MIVSRRKILSRSRDELHSDVFSRAGKSAGAVGGGGGPSGEEDDVWTTKERLFQVRLANCDGRKIFKRPVCVRSPSSYSVVSAKCAFVGVELTRRSVVVQACLLFVGTYTFPPAPEARSLLPPAMLANLLRPAVNQ